MSEAESSEAESSEPDATAVESVPGAVRRTLGEPFRARADAEMDVVGWSVFLGLLILLLPLLPVLVAVWLVTKGIEAVARARG